jgi:hypothetical protein
LVAAAFLEFEFTPALVELEAALLLEYKDTGFLETPPSALFLTLRVTAGLTGGEYDAHTPQLPPLEQCAHLLQFEHALQ